MKPGLALIAAAAVAALGACGSTVVPTPVPPPTGALLAWVFFPADASPRPILWLYPSPANGYATGENTLPAYCYSFATLGPLPASFPATGSARWPDGTTATYPGISADNALAGLGTARTFVQEGQCDSNPSVVISGARLGSFEFATDRGSALMNAWLFSAIGVDSEFAYPAIAYSAFWTGGPLPNFTNNSVVVSADGRSLTDTFYGAPSDPGPCGADYKGVVAESQFAVAIAVQELSHAQSGQVAACPAVAEQRSVVVALTRPLGGRVVVDASGNVMVVCPATKPDC